MSLRGKHDNVALAAAIVAHLTAFEPCLLLFTWTLKTR